MTFLDWVFKQRYDNEREWLCALLLHTQEWFNELTKPLAKFLFEYRSGGIIDSEEYKRIAASLMLAQVECNHGDYLRNTKEQMSSRGIPLFSNRQRLFELTEEFLKAGYCVKSLANAMINWDQYSRDTKDYIAKDINEQWESFEKKKDVLVSEINSQLRALG